MLDQRKKTLNVNVKISKKSKRLRNVNVRGMANESKAQYLVEKFERQGCADADGCFYFFVKCFSRLSEDTIWSIYEKATTDASVNSKIKYFIGACRNQMNS